MSQKIYDRGNRIMKALLRAGIISVGELVDQIGTSAPFWLSQQRLHYPPKTL